MTRDRWGADRLVDTTSANRAAIVGPAHPREKPDSRRGKTRSRETQTLRWRELGSNHRFISKPESSPAVCSGLSNTHRGGAQPPEYLRYTVDPKTAAASAHSTVIAGTGTGFHLSLPLGSIISEIKL